MTQVLEHLVVRKIEKNVSGDELQQILRFGSEQIFKDDQGTANGTTDLGECNCLWYTWSCACVSVFLTRIRACV